jgi:hypothetical protein
MEPGMPSHASVYLWLLQKPEFSDKYARARDEQAETLADEIIAIADEPPAEVTDDKGVSRTDSGWVTWQKTRMDARKWVASKLKPKKYGEKTTAELTIKRASEELGDDELAAIAASGSR